MIIIGIFTSVELSCYTVNKLAIYSSLQTGDKIPVCVCVITVVKIMVIRICHFFNLYVVIWLINDAIIY